jgi:putative lipoic acid-binding regulatory protein
MHCINVEEEMMISNNKKLEAKPEISYPTDWGFKLIGKDKKALLACIEEVMGNKEHTCSLGHTSKTGKYQTYNTSCKVDSEEERNQIFKSFQEHDAVKIVL